MKAVHRILFPLCLGAVFASLSTFAAVRVAWSQSDAVEAQGHEDEMETKKMAEAKDLPQATIETSMGSIVLALYPDSAPKAVENFIGLAKKGYYDGVIFHRVIKDFMIQTGDPTGTGMGGKSIWQLPFEDEIDKSLRFDHAGVLAMANTGRPKSNGSQFFITLGPTTWLNDRHTIFGEVIGGMDVVEAIGHVETAMRDKPVKDVTIQKVTIRMPGEKDGE
jgi:cyclophilin family peptidyl-prolyl cis-trans isomerase